MGVELRELDGLHASGEACLCQGDGGRGVHVMFLISRIEGRRFIDSMGVVASFPPVLYTGGKEVSMPIPDTLDSLTLRRDRIQQEFASLGDLRPGSLTRRLQQCGKPGCRCKAEGATGHGPYWSLTFKVQGKTVTRSIPAAAVERTREQIAEHKRFRALAAELVDLSEQLCQARLAEGDDGSDDEEKKTPSRRPSSPRSRPRSRRC